MNERASVNELFSPDELLTLMQFDFNAPVGGLINLAVETPYGIASYPPVWMAKTSNLKMTSAQFDEYLKKKFGG